MKRIVFAPWKPQHYNEREMEAVRNADRCVVRILRPPGGWLEMEFWPEGQETLVDCINRVQAAVKQLPRDVRAAIYIGGEVRGERRIAVVRGARTP